jgi:hypothetical protein
MKRFELLILSDERERQQRAELKKMRAELEYMQAWLALERLLFEQRRNIKAGFDPNQPRVPPGSSAGGQWSGDGSNSGVSIGGENDRSLFREVSDGLFNIDAEAADKHEPKYSTPDGYIYGDKIKDDITERKWTHSEIEEAVKYGERIDAINFETKGPATRYVNPETGKSVVIDNTTNQILQVGRDDFKHSVKSGDKPGAVIRPSPNPRPSGGGGIINPKDPFGKHPESIFDEELLE